METQPICPSCQKTLPPGAPLGLCPECLIKSGFKTGTEPGNAGKDSGFVAPSVEEVRQLFPQLEIIELIGKGGMGAVYKARQPALDRFVALKILPPGAADDAGFAERFNREARALARLSHPHIVAVHDFGQLGGQPYLVMEYVDGPNLRLVEQAGRLRPEQALQIVPQICEALQFAHNEGIVHRDIKPENILMDKKGRVKITDFGIAKILGVSSDKASLTGAKDVVGTPHYMAPEQVEHPRSVDHRADIYSLGVVFYEMLTGELPLGKFAAPSRKVQMDVRLDEVVLRTLEKEPELRYQQASEVKTQVETIAATQEHTPASPPVDSPSDINPWQPAILVVGSLFGLILLLVGTALPRPVNVIALLVGSFSLVVSVVKLAGFWPFPSGLFPRSNFTRRNLPSARPASSSPAPHPDRFWRRFAVAIALVLLAMILIPIGAVMLAMILPAMNRARNLAHPQPVAIKQVENTSHFAFSPVKETLVTAQRPIYMLDLDNGKEMELPTDRTTGTEEEFFNLIAARGVDLMSQSHRESWTLTTSLKLASLADAAWANATPEELQNALNTGANSLHREDTGFGYDQYNLKNSFALPLTFAFQTRQGRSGLLQFASSTDSPRSLIVRYKLLQNHEASSAVGGRAAEEAVTLALKQNNDRQEAKEKIVETAVDLGGGVKMEFVLIQPGSFVMGENFGDEAPAHPVTISKPFYLGKFEVTQEQWDAVMTSNPSYFKGPKLPVDNISWDDAHAFLRKLQEKTGRKVSLPTEAQWEYACRAGTTTLYSFGDSETDLEDYGWYAGNSDGTTHPVGEKKPNPWGLYDMHGNVSEWCADKYSVAGYNPSPFSRATATDPIGLSAGDLHVIRGGGFTSEPNGLRSSNRNSDWRGYQRVGLRCVIKVDAKEK